ncbi:MAG: endonuclease III [Bacilli bacterium]|nr:endonuclease III [Bacilli bacterium]
MKKLNEQEQKVIAIIKSFLIETGIEQNILQGNLLKLEAKKLLIENPNAFLLGLIADQSVKAEIAWSLPYNLKQRIGTFDFDEIYTKYNETSLEQVLKEKPALHRYPGRISVYIFSAIETILNKHKGNAKNIWENKTASEIVLELEEFKGISHKKASLGTLLLVRDLGLQIIDKENIDIAYDVHIKRIFGRVGLVNVDSEENILNAARRLNPKFPGELTTAFWTIGRKYCYATDPQCLLCPLNNVCEKNKIDASKN